MNVRAAFFAVALAILIPTAVRAADESAFVNDKIRIAEVNGDGGYRVPKTEAYKPIRAAMMKRKVLEEFVKFLSPMRLPKTLWLFTDECAGGEGASPFYSSDARALVMCYQFMKFIFDRADLIAKAEKQQPSLFPMTVSHDGFIAGVFAGIMLHEAGHAMFDNLDAPIFGREEDAADEISTFVALQFQRKVAELVVASYADIGETFDNPPTQAPDTKAKDYPTDETQRCFADPFCAFADVHGTWGQRFFNTICLMYGSDAQHYKFLADKGWVPRNRDCVGEYVQVRHAFEKTIYPFIDHDQMAKVRARAWFQGAELK